MRKKSSNTKGLFIKPFNQGTNPTHPLPYADRHPKWLESEARKHPETNVGDSQQTGEAEQE